MVSEGYISGVVPNGQGTASSPEKFRRQMVKLSAILST